MHPIHLESWSDFKALVVSKSLLMQYKNTVGWYEVYAAEAGEYLWRHNIAKDSGVDQTDFEANYMPSANARIGQPGITLTGRLMVDTGDAAALKPAFVQFKEDLENDLLDITTGTRWGRTILGSANSSVASCTLSLTVTTGATDSVQIQSLPSFSASEGIDYISFSGRLNIGALRDANNTRDFGAMAFSGSDGAYFRFSGTTLYAVVKKGGTETSTATTAVLNANWHLYEVRITASSIITFYVDGILVYTYSATTAVLVNALKFALYLRNANTSAPAVAPVLSVTTMAIMDSAGGFSRLGGLDPNRVVREIQTDKSGRLINTGPASVGEINSFHYDSLAIGPYLPNLWRKVMTYNISAGMTLNMIKFLSLSSRTDSFTRLVREAYLGQYVIGTQSFSQGNVYSTISAKYSSTVEAEVTTIIGAAGVTLTMTYTNQAGTAGQTATVTFLANDVIGTKRPFVLTAGDVGVKAITAMARSGAATGTVKLVGIDELAHHSHEISNKMYESIEDNTAIIIPGGVGNTINLEITGSAITPAQRKIRALYSTYLTTMVVMI